MSKRTLGLIVFLFIITAGLIYIAVSPKNTSKENTAPTTRIIPAPIPQTKISISPNPFTASSPSGSLEINIDTGKNNVTAVQIELSFDPKTLTKVTLTPGGFFENPMVLINDVDYKNGKISYAIGISPSGTPKTGKGVVAKIEFTADPQDAVSTKINFMPKTLVTASEATTSVLKEALGTEIIFARTTIINTSAPDATLPQ